MEFIDYDVDNAQYFEKVYQEAFPEQEQLPLDFLKHKAQQPSVHMTIITELNTSVGICLHIETSKVKQTGYILYLAIDPLLRGQNMGSKTLTALKAIYPGGFILESELTGTNAHNESQREKRIHFYTQNNLTDTKLISKNQAGSFHLLRTTNQVTSDDYLIGVTLMGLETSISNTRLI